MEAAKQAAGVLTTLVARPTRAPFRFRSCAPNSIRFDSIRARPHPVRRSRRPAQPGFSTFFSLTVVFTSGDTLVHTFRNWARPRFLPEGGSTSSRMFLFLFLPLPSLSHQFHFLGSAGDLVLLPRRPAQRRLPDTWKLGRPLLVTGGQSPATHLRTHAGPGIPLMAF